MVVYSLIYRYQRFEAVCCFHHQEEGEMEASCSPSMFICIYQLYSVISQMTVILMLIILSWFPRCLSVINPIRSESRSAESWRGLLARIRHLLLAAYNRTLIKFEEVIRDQRERRNEPGWSFCQYFLLQVTAHHMYTVLIPKFWNQLLFIMDIWFIRTGVAQLV